MYNKILRISILCFISIILFEPVSDSREIHHAVYKKEDKNIKNAQNFINDKNYIKDIEIEGINIIDKEEILKNLEIHNGEKYNEDKIVNSLKNIYSIGYFTEKMKAVPIKNSDKSITLKIIVKEYPPIKDFIIEGNTVISNYEISAILEPLKGKPQNINIINKTLREVEENYKSQGYLLARVDSIKDDPDGTMYVHINEGEINKISILGNKKTKKYIIKRNIQTREGTIYNENFLKEDLVRLYATQIFKDVTREIKQSIKNPSKYDVNVIVQEQRTGDISLTGGIDSAIGIFGSAGIQDKNFRGLGQRASFNVLSGYNALLNNPSVLNHVNFQMELSFFEPYFLNADNSLMNKIYFKDFGSYQIPLAIEKRIGGEITLAHQIKERKNLTGTFSLGIEKVDVSEGNYGQISNLYASHNLDIAQRVNQLQGGLFLSMTPGLIYDSRDSKINPRSGVLANLRANESFNLQGFESSFGTATASIKKYFPIGKKSAFSLLARGGMKTWGTMPEVMTFGLGGPYSIRGFYMNGVGTGNQFLMGSAELATPIPFLDKLKLKFIDNVKMTFFVDAGKVFNPGITDTIYDRPMQALTAGIGLKVFIPGMGPISLDYGIPLLNPGSNNSTKGYFSFRMSDMMY